MKRPGRVLTPSINYRLGACAVVAAVAFSTSPALAQTAIRPGQTLAGELSSADPTLDDGSHYDCFVLQSQRGQRVQIDQMSEAFDSYLQVGTGDCGNLTLLQTDDDGGGGTNARVTINGDGTRLTLRINSLLAHSTGRYTLAAQAIDRVGQSNAHGLAPSDPFDTPAVYIGATAAMASFGLPYDVRPGGITEIPVFSIFRTAESAGTDAAGRPIVFDTGLVTHEVNCRTRTIRRVTAEAHFNRQTVFSERAQEAFAGPTAGSMDVEIIRVACAPSAYIGLRTYASLDDKVARARRVWTGTR